MYNTVDYRASKKGYIRVNCPYCLSRVGKADTKYTMSINTKSNSFYCFRCGYSSKTGGLTNKIKDLISVIGEKTGDPQDLRDSIMDLKFGKKRNKFIKLESISEQIDYSEDAIDYVKSRGMSDEDIENYSIRLGTSGRWRNRVLFPLFDEKGRCIYVVGRDITGESDRRYLNSPAPKGKYLYGIDQVGDSRTVVLTEGVISGITAKKVTGVPWVCLLGKSFSEEQLDYLNSKVDNVIISLDGGVEYKKLASSLMFKGMGVDLIELPEGKDPNDLGEEYITYYNNTKKLTLKDLV